MTVSKDGKLVCTDPGIGILAPGWHYSGTGTQVGGGGTGCGGTAARGPNEPGGGRPPATGGKKGPCEPEEAEETLEQQATRSNFFPVR